MENNKTNNHLFIDDRNYSIKRDSDGFFSVTSKSDPEVTIIIQVISEQSITFLESLREKRRNAIPMAAASE